jgi:hypothetical protein
MAHALIGEPYNRELYRISVYLTGEEYLGAKRTRRANQSFAPSARCLVLFEKIFLLFRNANQAYDLPSHPERGALRNVINAGRAAVDADGAFDESA